MNNFGETVEQEINRLEENKALMLEQPYPMATNSIAGAQEFARLSKRLIELYDQKKQTDVFKTSAGPGC